MKVILKKDVQSLGESGDVLEVKDGYARNYLLYHNFAELATEGALENRKRNLARIKAKAEKLHKEALTQGETVKALKKIEILAKAGENGKLFGAITTKRLADEIKTKTGLEIDRRNISLNKPINVLGEYTMLVKLTSKVSVELPIIISASEFIKEESLTVEEESIVQE